MQTNTLATWNNLATNMPATWAGGRGAKLTTKAADEIMQKTHLATIHEQGRALLAYTALENTMMLSEMERTCYKVAPFGEERYQQIVNAYAASAAMKIARW